MGLNTVNLFVGPFNINFCTEKKKKTYRLANSAQWVMIVQLTAFHVAVFL